MLDKGSILGRAFKYLRISGLTSEPTPDDVQDALVRLEDLMSANDALGARLGYNFEDKPKTDTDAGMPRWAYQGIGGLLAQALATDYGLSLTNECYKAMRAGIQAITLNTVDIPEVEYPGRQARGSGNLLRRRFRSRFYRNADKVATQGDFLQDNFGQTVTSVNPQSKEH